MAKKWAEVVANPDFQALPDDEKINARNQYFDEVVTPKISNPADIDSLRAQFYKESDASIAASKTANDPDTSRYSARVKASTPASDVPQGDVVNANGTVTSKPAFGNTPVTTATEEPSWYAHPMEQLEDVPRELTSIAANVPAQTANLANKVGNLLYTDYRNVKEGRYNPFNMVQYKPLNEETTSADLGQAIGEAAPETGVTSQTLVPRTTTGKVAAEVAPYLVGPGEEKAAVEGSTKLAKAAEWTVGKVLNGAPAAIAEAKPGEEGKDLAINTAINTVFGGAAPVVKKLGELAHPYGSALRTALTDAPTRAFSPERLEKLSTAKNIVAGAPTDATKANYTAFGDHLDALTDVMNKGDTNFSEASAARTEHVLNNGEEAGVVDAIVDLSKNGFPITDASLNGTVKDLEGNSKPIYEMLGKTKHDVEKGRAATEGIVSPVTQNGTLVKEAGADTQSFQRDIIKSSKKTFDDGIGALAETKERLMNQLSDIEARGGNLHFTEKQAYNEGISSLTSAINALRDSTQHGFSNPRENKAIIDTAQNTLNRIQAEHPEHFGEIFKPIDKGDNYFAVDKLYNKLRGVNELATSAMPNFRHAMENIETHGMSIDGALEAAAAHGPAAAAARVIKNTLPFNAIRQQELAAAKHGYTKTTPQFEAMRNARTPTPPTAATESVDALKAGDTAGAAQASEQALKDSGIDTGTTAQAVTPEPAPVATEAETQAAQAAADKAAADQQASRYATQDLAQTKQPQQMEMNFEAAPEEAAPTTTAPEMAKEPAAKPRRKQSADELESKAQEREKIAAEHPKDKAAQRSAKKFRKMADEARAEEEAAAQPAPEAAPEAAPEEQAPETGEATAEQPEAATEAPAEPKWLGNAELARRQADIEAQRAASKEAEATMRGQVRANPKITKELQAKQVENQVIDKLHGSVAAGEFKTGDANVMNAIERLGGIKKLIADHGGNVKEITDFVKKEVKGAQREAKEVVKTTGKELRDTAKRARAEARLNTLGLSDEAKNKILEESHVNGELDMALFGAKMGEAKAVQRAADKLSESQLSAAHNAMEAKATLQGAGLSADEVNSLMEGAKNDEGVFSSGKFREMFSTFKKGRAAAEEEAKQTSKEAAAQSQKMADFQKVLKSHGMDEDFIKKASEDVLVNGKFSTDMKSKILNNDVKEAITSKQMPVTADKLGISDELFEGNTDKIKEYYNKPTVQNSIDRFIANAGIKDEASLNMLHNIKDWKGVAGKINSVVNKAHSQDAAFIKAKAGVSKAEEVLRDLKADGGKDTRTAEIKLKKAQAVLEPLQKAHDAIDEQAQIFRGFLKHNSGYEASMDAVDKEIDKSVAVAEKEAKESHQPAKEEDKTVSNIVTEHLEAAHKANPEITHDLLMHLNNSGDLEPAEFQGVIDFALKHGDELTGEAKQGWSEMKSITKRADDLMEEFPDIPELRLSREDVKSTANKILGKDISKSDVGAMGKNLIMLTHRTYKYFKGTSDLPTRQSLQSALNIARNARENGISEKKIRKMVLKELGL